MLRPALEYESTLRNKFVNKIWFEDKYKYFNASKQNNLMNRRKGIWVQQ